MVVVYRLRINRAAAVLCGSCSLGLSTPDAVNLLGSHLGKKAKPQDRAKKAHLGDGGQCRLCNSCHECFATASTNIPAAKSTGPTSHPSIAMHKQILDIIVQLEKELPGFIDLASCLSNQQQLARYPEAMSQRAKIDKLFGFLDLKSKQVLGMVKDQNPASSSFRVHSKIRARVVEYLQNNMIPLPQLPPEKDVALWRQKTERAEQKVRADQQRAEAKLQMQTQRKRQQQEVSGLVFIF